ncbi:MAG: hypothetical protein EZS28_007275 [Streblomastix strix]|uniref:Uncharacterized protein n=1 Tax=Streblomastix strix TaxID=222440 RepID=A0A5J4WS05_9EUKA|nr:MAG: hypothetical protein EZS28_007275 [Streblomastix strix]
MVGGISTATVNAKINEHYMNVSNLGIGRYGKIRGPTLNEQVKDKLFDISERGVPGGVGDSLEFPTKQAERKPALKQRPITANPTYQSSSSQSSRQNTSIGKIQQSPQPFHRSPRSQRSPSPGHTVLGQKPPFPLPAFSNFQHPPSSIPKINKRLGKKEEDGLIPYAPNRGDSVREEESKRSKQISTTRSRRQDDGQEIDFGDGPQIKDNDTAVFERLDEHEQQMSILTQNISILDIRQTKCEETLKNIQMMMQQLLSRLGVDPKTNNT